MAPKSATKANVSASPEVVETELTPQTTPQTSPERKRNNNTKKASNAEKSPTSTTKKTVSRSKKNSPVTSDNETNSPTEKKLSAVPMPLVKKVKEQLDNTVTFKNLTELKNVLEAFIQVIVDSTMKGDSVTLPNYMTFKRVLRNERTHMNPKTKEKIVKPEHYVLSMYVKAQLKKEFEQIEVTEEDKAKLASPSKKAAGEETGEKSA